MMAITQLPPLSLYIHVPWCVKKCPYCDFNSHAVKADIPENEYIERLLEDLSNDLPLVWGRKISSIFIGGGTPSLLHPRAYEKLLSGIRALMPFQADIEITMEANPGTAEARNFSGFLEAGINRFSIGIQSFNDTHLKKLGRIHSAKEAVAAYKIAREVGCTNINLDLMYALPNQTTSEALNDIDIALELAPEHLSWYQLTLEPNTLFYAKPPKLPEDDLMDDIAESGLAKLEENSYRRYEVSAYSLNGLRPSQHNLNYWQFGDYLGIGAGAHGKITRADTQTISRISKKRHPKDYLSQDVPFIDSEKTIATDELPLEFMMNAMRLKNGVEQTTFFETTGIIYSTLSKAIDAAKDQGLVEDIKNRLAPTEKGFLFLNELLEHFMPEHFKHLKAHQDIPIKSL